ncbi:hypothetical protein BU26DRAFT_589875 [Trematosphaeria pertusa]|uniref:RING-type domain-containing protein n=1 Tax=Trematosphaeria pertusa TaxID=390896 RepID=A0A6A6IPY6_9PLEO|nr:uncharacterized protein BU26DRAFT_589875 [Trematosphaeria pertusa]KAF2251650.1 hypothetical protein BU26DRAFT_589875 [Trematosphaeria pertusa]
MPAYSPQYDLPPPAKMSSRSNPRNAVHFSRTDWSRFIAQPFHCLGKIVSQYKDSKVNLSKALNALAQFVLDVQMDVYYDSYRELHSYTRAPGRPYMAHLNFYGHHDLPISMHDFIVGTDLNDIYLFIVASSDVYDPENWFENLTEDQIRQWRSEAKDWILSCGLHPDMDCEVQNALKPLAGVQPVYAEDKSNTNSNYCEQRELRSAGGAGAWPDLTRMLKEFVPSEEDQRADFDEQGINRTVMWFLRIAFNAAESYTQGVEDKPAPQTKAVKKGLRVTIKKYSQMVENPNSSVPLHIRWALSKLQFQGNWQWMIRFVLPTILRFQQREHIEFFVYQWVMRAALHPDIDPTGKVRDILGKTFNLEGVVTPVTGIPNRAAFASGRLLGNSFVLFHPHFLYCDHSKLYIEDEQHPDDKYTGPEDSFSDFETQILDVPTLGRPEWVVEHHHQKADARSHTHPSSEPDDVCYICRLGYDEHPCFKLDVCKHGYHLECLQDWMDFFNHGEILCPYCCRVICMQVGQQSRSMTIEEHRQWKPYWANPAWWEQFLLDEDADEGEWGPVWSYWMSFDDFWASDSDDSIYENDDEDDDTESDEEDEDTESDEEDDDTESDEEDDDAESDEEGYDAESEEEGYDAEFD